MWLAAWRRGEEARAALLWTKLPDDVIHIVLDFFEQLLTPDGAALKEELKLDGTHMHPDYTKIMEAELAKVPAK